MSLGRPGRAETPFEDVGSYDVEIPPLVPRCQTYSRVEELLRDLRTRFVLESSTGSTHGPLCFEGTEKTSGGLWTVILLIIVYTLG